MYNSGYAPRRTPLEIADMRTMHLTGASYRIIGKKYGITRERVRQIIAADERKRSKVEKAKCRCCQPRPIWWLQIELTEAQMDWKRNRVECEFWIYKQVPEGTRYFGWREVYRANNGGSSIRSNPDG